LERHGVGAIIKEWGYASRISKSTISLLEKMLQIDPQRRVSLDQVLAHPVFNTEAVWRNSVLR
jgi:serine/threonine protein kinase